MTKKRKKRMIALACMFALITTIVAGKNTVFAEPNNLSETNMDLLAFEHTEKFDEFNTFSPGTEIDMPPKSLADVSDADTKDILNEVVSDEESGEVTEGETSQSNSDPNNAYYLTNNTAWSGTIEAANDILWYVLEASTKSKVTVYLTVDDALDADLYLFSLDENSSLQFVESSLSGNAGEGERLNLVVDPGIYFIAVHGYESIGNYNLFYFQSTADVANEINDNQENATELQNRIVTGVIDNPFDYDYYKLVIDTPEVIKYELTSSDGYVVNFVGKEGTGADIGYVGKDKLYVNVKPGTYYFVVRNVDYSTYSSDSTYSLSFRKIAEWSGRNDIIRMGVSEAAGIVYEANADHTSNYVNGHLIDIGYSYVYSSTNSAGTQSYDISIDPNMGEYAVYDDEYRPIAVHYNGSTKPAKYMNSRPALLLTYVGQTPFYGIHCSGTGAYAMNRYHRDLDAVQVLIDPLDGKLVDIVHFNYYYDYATPDMNYISIGASYDMKFYPDK